MSKYLDHAKKYHNAIRKILMDDWDPLGVKGILEAIDEYDSSISKIYKLLIHHESEESIFRYLWEVETINKGVKQRGQTKGSNLSMLCRQRLLSYDES